MNHYEWRIKQILNNLKNKRFVWVLDKGLWIRTVNRYDIKLCSEFTRWRKNAKEWFPSIPKQFNLFRTRSWFNKHLMDKEDRVLFLVYDEVGPIGHLGFYRFDFEDGWCEVDNVLRGENRFAGAMGKAQDWTIRWAFNNLEINDLYLRVFKDNERAVSFYKKHGFQIVSQIPLEKIEKEKEWVYVPTKEKPDRINLVMKYIGKRT